MSVNIISIESSGRPCSVALGIDGVLAVNYTHHERNMHDSLLAEYVRRMMNENKLAIEDIDAVVISSGPGSFTGLRVGASLAKGLCYGESPKLIAVPTLDALAFYAYKSISGIKFNKIIAAIPSNRGMMFFKEFSGEYKAHTEVELKDMKYIADIDNLGNLIVGEFSQPIEKATRIDALNLQSAEKLLQLAFAKYETDEFENPAKFTPLYHQDFTPRNEQKEINLK